jgi:hypothetical protein
LLICASRFSTTSTRLGIGRRWRVSIARGGGVACRGDPDLLFQELIEAAEITVDAYIASSGRCVVSVQRVRDMVVAGQSYRSHTVDLPTVGALASTDDGGSCTRRIARTAHVQIFQTETPLLVEVNTRLSSAVVLSNLACGGRLLDALLGEALGGTVADELSEYRVGLQLSRYLGDVFHAGNELVAIKPG